MYIQQVGLKFSQSILTINYMRISGNLCKAFITIFFAGCIFGCMNSNKSTNESMYNESDEKLPLSHTDDRTAQLLALTDEIASQVQLKPLSADKAGNKFEFRLWTNVGNFFEKILIVNKTANEARASFFDVERSGNSLKFNTKYVTAPRSGWENFFRTIREHRGVQVPLPLNLDPPTRPVRDEGLVFLEILDHGNYDFVYCGQLTTSFDGKRLLDLCEYMSREFNVHLDCLGKYTSP